MKKQNNQHTHEEYTLLNIFLLFSIVLNNIMLLPEIDWLVAKIGLITATSGMVIIIIILPVLRDVGYISKLN